METSVNFIALRPWGYEAQCTVTADDGTVYNEVVSSKAELPEAEYVVMVESTILNRIEQAAKELIIPTESIEIINQDGTAETMEVPV